MSQGQSRNLPRCGRSVRLSAVDWRTYSRLVLAFAEQPGVHLAYDRGELEIIGPSPEISPGLFLGRLVSILTEELGLPIRHAGSTTLRRRRFRRGIDPHESFWITNAHRMAGRRRLDLRTDPPPDLAIEVDVIRSSLDRLGIYAALSVPEVWRLSGDTLTFYILGGDRKYTKASASRSFPLVAPIDLLPFLQQAEQVGDENAVGARVRAWIQQRQAAAGGPSTGP
jgi:Uma2 family endonuclease